MSPRALHREGHCTLAVLRPGHIAGHGKHFATTQLHRCGLQRSLRQVHQRQLHAAALQKRGDG
jgi:hypothetical protein